MKIKFNIIALLVGTTALTFSSCKKSVDNGPQSQTVAVAVAPDLSENGTNPDQTVFSDLKSANANIAYLYTESNAEGQNQILSYKQKANGSLTYLTMVASGGMGSGASLGSQGALALDQFHHLLFAVNAGDNTVSSFVIGHDGSLKLASTIGSKGQQPISLTAKNKLLYVLNGASDSISGFRYNALGVLSFINGSRQSLNGMGTGAEQISFSPNGKYLYVSEKVANKITTFPVNVMGVAGSGTTISSTGMTPYGFAFSRDRFLVISNASGGGAGASTCTSYKGVNVGLLLPVNGEVADTQTAACWLTTTEFGRFAYVSNAGSNNISSYYIGPEGGLHLAKAVAATAGTHPVDIVVAPNNYYVYNLNSGSQTISGYHREFFGGLIVIGTTTGLPVSATGLIAFEQNNDSGYGDY